MLDRLLVLLHDNSSRLLATLLVLALAFPLSGVGSYLIYLVTLAFILSISALGMNIILGYAGQFNLAHAGFMAIGAYAVGILTVDHRWGFWPAFLVAGPLAALFGFGGGVISLRLKGHFFSIFTLCLGYIVYLIIEKADGLTHGTVGIIDIPAPPGFGPLNLGKPVPLYYLALAFLLAALFLKHRIVTSLLGRAFIAVRNSEDLAQALGVNLMRTKVIAFTLSTFYAGVAGALYAGFVRFIGPAIALEGNTFELVMFILVGGVGTLFGPLLGTITLTTLTESLQFLKELRMVVFAPLLVALVIFFPQGVLGYARERIARLEARRRAEEARDAGA